jgi:ribosomal-protein-alanine N-acetyltransferase
LSNNLNILLSSHTLLKIRSFVDDDLSSIEELEHKAFEVGPYSRRMLKRIFSKKGSFNVVAEEDGKIVGYAVAMPLDLFSADIESIAVDPDFHGRGIGTVIIREIEDEMVKRGYLHSILEVRDRNVEAIGFYKKNGYTVLEYLPTYYTEDFRGSKGAIRMHKFMKNKNSK